LTVAAQPSFLARLAVGEVEVYGTQNLMKVLEKIYIPDLGIFQLREMHWNTIHLHVKRVVDFVEVSRAEEQES